MGRFLGFDRETPGTRASACAAPISTASFSVSLPIGRSVRPSRSAMPSTTPITISVVPMIHRLRKSRSMTSLSSTPSTTIGSDPTMMYQPIRESSVPRYSAWNRDRTQATPMRQMSLRK